MHSVVMVHKIKKNISILENETSFDVLGEAELMYIRQNPDYKWGYESYFIIKNTMVDNRIKIILDENTNTTKK